MKYLERQVSSVTSRGEPAVFSRRGAADLGLSKEPASQPDTKQALKNYKGSVKELKKLVKGGKVCVRSDDFQRLKGRVAEHFEIHSQDLNLDRPSVRKIFNNWEDESITQLSDPDQQKTVKRLKTLSRRLSKLEKEIDEQEKNGFSRQKAYLTRKYQYNGLILPQQDEKTQRITFDRFGGSEIVSHLTTELEQIVPSPEERRNVLQKQRSHPRWRYQTLTPSK